MRIGVRWFSSCVYDPPVWVAVPEGQAVAAEAIPEWVIETTAAGAAIGAANARTATLFTILRRMAEIPSVEGTPTSATTAVHPCLLRTNAHRPPDGVVTQCHSG